jgi:GDP-L-fucose synthase
MPLATLASWREKIQKPRGTRGRKAAEQAKQDISSPLREATLRVLATWREDTEGNTPREREPSPPRIFADRVHSFKGKIISDASKPDGQPRRRLDTSRAKRLFGFEAKMALPGGLRKTRNWFLRERHQNRGSPEHSLVKTKA